jgi:hypothetical protein
MTTPNETGTQFEKRCYALLTTFNFNYRVKERVRHSEHYWYEPDAITDEYVFEFKYQQVGGSAKNKLTQALFELDWLANKLSKIPVLVYEGDRLTSFVKNDPAFRKALSFVPHVQVLNSKAFNDLISTSADLNNREQNRLLEYA